MRRAIQPQRLTARPAGMSSSYDIPDDELLERKLHRHLLPPLVLLITFSFIDRTNLAFASLQMNKDLGFSPSVYGLAAGSFFAGYALFQVPSNIIIDHLGPSLWLCILSLLWGCCATLFAAVRTPTQFVLLRFALGLCESGAIPGAWYYLGLFYQPSRLTLPYAVIETSITVSQVLGAPLAASLLTLDGTFSMRGWQWIFLCEGLPTILLAFYIKAALPDSVDSAAFLNAAEKLHLATGTCPTGPSPPEHIPPPGPGRSTPAQTGPLPQTRTPISTLQLLREVASNWKIWYAGGWRMLHDSAGYGILYWTPVIIGTLVAPPATQKLGATSTSSQGQTGTSVALLTTIPFAAASLFHLANAAHSQLTGERRLHISFTWAAGAAALLMLPTAAAAKHTLGAFALLVLAHVGVNGANGCQTAWVSALQGPQSRGVGLALYNTLGNVGGFVGPYAIGLLYEQSGSYGSAAVLLGACLLVAALMVLGFRDQHGETSRYILLSAHNTAEESSTA